jgi:hypothetical protein
MSFIPLFPGSGGSSGTPATTVRKTLRWAPPPQTNPTVVTAGTGFFSQTFGDTEDVILNMPASTRTGTLTVTGGRHIRVIGGKFAPTTTGSALRFTGPTGSVFLEGLDINMSAVNADAINVSGRDTTDPSGATYPDVYLQNIRAVGLNGTNATTHADVFQPQGPIGRLFVDKFTGRTNYQGFFVAPQKPITSIDMRRTDLGYEAGGDGNTYLLWFLDDNTQTPYPVRLEDVWCAPRSGQNVAAHAVWPASSQANIGALALADTTVRWPPLLRISGVVNPGAPSAGDFVPANSVGLGYVSPGYDVEYALSVGPAGANGTNGTNGTNGSDAGLKAFGLCATIDPSTPMSTGAISGANRMHFMRVRGAKTGATKVRIGIGTISGNISVGVYPNNGQTGRLAAPAGPAKAVTGSLAMSGLFQEDGTTPVASNTAGLVPLGATIDVAEGDWIGVAVDNITATLSRPQANPTHTDMLKGIMTVQATSAFPAPTTPAPAFISTPIFYATAE